MIVIEVDTIAVQFSVFFCFLFVIIIFLHDAPSVLCSASLSFSSSFSLAGGPATIFGSVALPLDSKHTQGAQIPMPIFDEGLNMKGVVRVAAQWSSNYPRRVKVVTN